MRPSNYISALPGGDANFICITTQTVQGVLRVLYNKRGNLLPSPIMAIPGNSWRCPCLKGCGLPSYRRIQACLSNKELQCANRLPTPAAEVHALAPLFRDSNRFFHGARAAADSDIGSSDHVQPPHIDSLCSAAAMDYWLIQCSCLLLWVLLYPGGHSCGILWCWHMLWSHSLVVFMPHTTVILQCIRVFMAHYCEFWLKLFMLLWSYSLDPENFMVTSEDLCIPNQPHGCCHGDSPRLLSAYLEFWLLSGGHVP
ncbi:hypothetical protein CEXT_541521 [Caerostris extrusa]|uniref:Uncharacterized protein n=1 Tax=Caerostris extrusa TaxID=172846 RepID=A0AAV4UN83_CAEEX|nr:hypothetical protein CEXT_541521 [Caerostris extrusa]